MSAFAPSQYNLPSSPEVASPRLSDEELGKLQEIHELVNLLMKELPAMPHAVASSYDIPMAQTTPYTYSFFQMPWGRLPFGVPHGL
ncbi:MAG TPA: hypothetical protein VJX67_22445 [Blastocatellia bacterium]|nr:hypothetical protein [Blastocatellia bacterium]